MPEEQTIGLTEKSQINLDIKTLIGIISFILAIAGVYFTLTGQIAALQLDVIRMQDSVEMNERI